MQPSLAQRISNEIRRDIIAGHFQPGDHLKADLLAERYKASANPVREALWQLQGEGFVVVTANQGARVRVVDDDFIRNIFELRELIEPIFVRRFCQRASSEDIDRLAAAHEAFAAAAQQEPLDFHLLDLRNRQFHSVITAEEPNIEALLVVERYGDIVNAARAKLKHTRGRALTRTREHAAILAAVRDHDPAGAAAAAAAHIHNASTDFLEQLRFARSRVAVV